MAIYLAFGLALFQMSSIRATRVLVTLFALTLGAQPLMIGVLAAMFAVFPMLLSWQAGKLADRFGARWLLTISAIVSAAGLALPYFFPNLIAVFIAVALTGLSLTFYNVTLQNLVGMLSNADTRVRNYSNYAMSISVATAVGPMLAGVSIDRWGHPITFIYVALVLLMSVALLGVWGGILPGGSRKETVPTGGMRQSLANPQIWPVLIASSTAQCGLEVFYVYLPVYAHQQGLSATSIGVMLGASAVGGFVARFQLPRLVAWMSAEKVLAYSLIFAALAFVTLPFFKTAFALSLVAFAFGFGVNCSQPISMTLMYSRSPAGRSGEALGLRFTLDNTARLVGPLLAGIIATAFGVGAAFWMTAVVLGAGGAITRKEVKGVER